MSSAKKICGVSSFGISIVVDVEQLGVFAAKGCLSRFERIDDLENKMK